MPDVKISDAEWDVMQVVWDLKEATAADVIERVAEPNGWNHRTVRTLLSRLVQKGALAVEGDGHKYRYRPTLTRQRCVRDAGQSFLDRIFAGDPAELLVHFVRTSSITPAEADRLKRMLDDKLRSED